MRDEGGLNAYSQEVAATGRAVRPDVGLAAAGAGLSGRGAIFWIGLTSSLVPIVRAEFQKGSFRFVQDHQHAGLLALQPSAVFVVLDHGRVREQGTHRELLQQDGLYAQMWALQQREQETREEERLLGLA